MRMLGMRGDGRGDDVVVETEMVGLWAEAAHGKNGIDARRGWMWGNGDQSAVGSGVAVLGFTQLLAEAEHASFWRWSGWLRAGGHRT